MAAAVIMAAVATMAAAVIMVAVAADITAVIMAAADIIVDFMAAAIGAAVATGAAADAGIGGTGFGTHTVCNRADLRRNIDRDYDIGGGCWGSPSSTRRKSISLQSDIGALVVELLERQIPFDHKKRRRPKAARTTSVGSR
jgi:hypothetical protein